MVVVKADVIADCRVEFGKVVEDLAADPFSLHGVEEGFHVGVVTGVPRPVHAGADAVFAQEGLVAVGRILDAAVGVEQQVLVAGPGTDGLLHRPRREVYRPVFSQGIAHDLS